MIERYGQWIAASIMVGLLIAVVLLFATVDLQFDVNTMTDVSSAPILSNGDPTIAPASPLPVPDSRPPVKPSTTVQN